jgi:hypothetical protein
MKLEVNEKFQCLQRTIPFRTFPNTTCFPSSQDVFLRVMKNWDLFVSKAGIIKLLCKLNTLFQGSFESNSITFSRIRH